jgi:hypothetical protein
MRINHHDPESTKKGLFKEKRLASLAFCRLVFRGILCPRARGAGI